ncbi:MAG: ribosome-associated translation inhibitor RaiA [Deltaproteobacteria bacterium]|nr:MAG: ribosome-associated translation inhibitor RaiA [Deltaproteobacteria bacterium]
MQVPLQIAWHDVHKSDAAEDDIRSQLASLEEQFDIIVGCRVTMELSHRHHKVKGNPLSVRAVFTVPQGEVAVHEDANGPTPADLHLAIKGAFDAARKQLRTKQDRLRGEVKQKG